MRLNVQMLIAGLVGHDEKEKTTNLINSLLASTGKKISIVDSKNLAGFDTKTVRSYISELDKNNVDILIFKINLNDIDSGFFDLLNFDVMILMDKADALKEDAIDLNYSGKMRRIFSLLDEKGMAIVNVDNCEMIKLLEGIKHNIVTYGFNSKASITTSSIGDTMSKENFMCCLQKSISARNGLLMEPQEYIIKTEQDELDAYNLLAAATFAIVNGVDLNLQHI